MAVKSFSRRHHRELAVAALYRQIVAQARQPAFYTQFGVPDTLDGRFELLVMHATLVFRRLKADASASAFAQELFDYMFADMDQALREMGVGDLSVGKHVKRMVQGFYGRVVAYDSALTERSREKLAAALRRNVYGTVSGECEPATRMAEYLEGQAANIAGQSVTALLSGEVVFAAAPSPVAREVAVHA